MADNCSLQGKVALVTGAAKRLGRATALALAQAGVHIIIHHNSSVQAARELAKQIRAQGIKAWTLQADLNKNSECEELFTKAEAAAGHIDFLINNASIFPRQRLTDFTEQELYENIQVNAVAPLLLSRRFAAQGRQGVIVNFLDTHITEYHASHAAYHISKRMLFTLTRMLALQYAPLVRVNAVAPGLILPPEGEDEDYLRAHADRNPLHTYGDENDVAEAVLFLIRSSFITGQVIFVDGGYHMKGSTYGR
jgi:pteridine reductase